MACISIGGGGDGGECGGSVGPVTFADGEVVHFVPVGDCAGERVVAVLLAQVSVYLAADAGGVELVD